MHLSRANGAIDTPANGNGFARQLASDMGVLADRHGMRAQIAVKNAVNLNIAGGRNLSDYLQILAQDRWGIFAQFTLFTHWNVPVTVSELRNRFRRY